MGWSNENKIVIESVEEVKDTNPDIYRKNAEKFFDEKNYSEALRYIDETIQLDNNRLQDRLLKVEILFESSNYKNALKYMIESNLWNEKNKLYSVKELKKVFSIFAICYKKCGLNPQKSQIIYLTSDGRGMYSSIQEAIDNALKGQIICLIDGSFAENIQVNNDIEICGITSICENMLFSTMSDNAFITSNYTGIIISGGRICFRNLNFESSSSKEVLVLRNTKIEMSNCNIKHKCDGIVVESDSMLNMTECKIYSAICEEGEKYASIKVLGNAKISNSLFEGCGNTAGVAIMGSQNSNTQIDYCQILKNYIAIKLNNNGKMIINNTKMKKNSYGVLVINGSLEVDEVSIEASKKDAYQCRGGKTYISCGNISFNGACGVYCDNGYVEIENCLIEGSKTSNLAVYNGNGKIVANNTRIEYGSAHGVYINDMGMCELSNCKVIKNAGDGIHEEGRNKVITKNCEIADNASLSGMLSGIDRFLRKF